MEIRVITRAKRGLIIATSPKLEPGHHSLQPFSQSKLVNSILFELSQSKEECVLEYEAVNSETADAVASDLDCRRETSNFRLVFEVSAIRIFSNKY